MLLLHANITRVHDYLYSHVKTWIIDTFSSACTHEIGLLANVLQRTNIHTIPCSDTDGFTLSRQLFNKQFDKTVSSALAWLSTYKPILWI